MRSSAPLPRVLLAVSCLMSASVASSEEWYDAYARGLKALEHHEADKAIANLERAARMRREPGTNVITYGTNWLDEYAPYLALAEAYVLAGKPDQARDALRRSEEFAREASDRRAKLAAIVDAALASPHGAPAAPSPTEAPGPGKDVTVLLLLARSHLIEAQTALATALERNPGLSTGLGPVAPRLSAAVRDLEKTLYGPAGGPDSHLPPR